MHNETIIHVLCDCAFASAVWNNFQKPMNFYNENLKTWLMTNTKSLSNNRLKLPWCTIFLFTICSIWLERNNSIYNNSVFNPSLIAKHALGKAAEFWSNFLSCNNSLLSLNHTLTHSLASHSVTPSWQPPPTSWVKLNYDGSSLNYQMGIGGCLRDANGLWIIGFSKFAGDGDALKAELLAI